MGQVRTVKDGSEAHSGASMWVVDDRQERTRRLWCAVILQALYEAAGRIAYAEKGEREILQREALTWFECAGQDFDQVCHLAGLDPEAVRAAALAAVPKATFARKRR